METIDHVGRKLAATLGLAAVTLVAGCEANEPLGLTDSPAGLVSLASSPATAPKATGTVEIVWPGGRGRVVPPGEEKLAFAEFNAFPPTTIGLARGTFTYRVLNADSTPHREIVATVTDAVVDVAQHKAWFTGMVISDVKICGGGSCDGDDGCSHDDGGCGDDGNHDDGGCSDDGSHDDGGCSDGTHDDGGCSDDGSHDDGGCSGSGSGGSGGSDGGCSDGSHDDGGCGDDGSHDDGGCSGGGSDGHGGSGGVSGKDPRVDQVVLVKVHDVGIPGTNGDGITWKWFASGTQLDLLEEPRHLCKKDIIGGNLVVHPVPGS